MALSSFNFDTLQWKSNIPTSFFLDLVAKNSLPMKKKKLTELKKLWITTGTPRSIYNKDKQHKKCLKEKRVLINKVLHDILKKNRNIIEIYNEKNMEKSYHVFCNKFPWS